MVLKVTLPTVSTFEPAATSHQRCAASTHLQIPNPLYPSVPHPVAAEPTMAAPRPLPGRFDFNLKTLNRVDPHSHHANTRQVQPYLHNIRHRGLSLDSAFWLFTDSSEASTPFQGFQPTHPTIPRSLYKTELIRQRGPWRNLDQVEYATLEYVDWFNHRRLLEPIGHIPPAEKESNYHRQQNRVQLAGLK